MKLKNTAAVVLATAIAMPCVLSIAGCGKKDDAKKDKTAYGNITNTATVKKPSNDVTVRLIRGKNVLKEEAGELNYEEALQAGDVIEIESDYKYININLFEELGEQMVYSPTGRFTFQIPSTASQVTYKSGTFGGGSHTFTASKASDAQVAKANRNLTVNPYDYMYVDEKNDQSAANNAMDAALTESQALEQVAAYPHAYANRVTRNEVGFYARNAIDGGTESGGHGNYPYQSWGYNQMTDAQFTVYFGREVSINQVGFVLRADYSKSNNKEHDTYWDSVTLEFSDGSTQSITEFEKSGDIQKFGISEVSTTYIRIKDIKEVQNLTGSEMYAALTEFEAYGSEKVTKNEAAVKTSITPTFGGKDQTKFTTSDFKYQDIKDIMDKSNDWFIEKTENTDFKIPNHDGSPMQVKINDAGWKDAVYYSGLTEAFLTTGDMNGYYFLRGVGNGFSYKVNDGHLTPHGDDYQIGETYLMLDDLLEASYKTAGVFANAEYNLARKMDDKTPPKVTGGEWIDSSRDWSHMGWWWCDALYMAMNTYTLLTLKTGDKKYVEQAYEGYKYWKGNLYNEKYHLWHRDQKQFQDWTTLTDEDGNKVATFWSRGNAWVHAALAKQLMYLDKDEFPEIYAEYEQDYKDISASLAQYQRADGTWNASIIDPDFYGGKESTGTMGFIYAYCIGLRLGVLDAKTYYPIVKDAWNGIVDECIFESGQVGYMQTTGYQPKNYKDEETSKGNTHEFGMGLFLLACSGMMSICSDYQTPSIIVPADPQAALLG